VAVHIRLRRIGKNPKGRPHFRITVFDHHRGRDSKFIEELGYYNPIKEQIKLNLERLEYWVKNGAQLSQTLKSLVKKYRREVRVANTAS
jgi:small subunit ribosomal protein S16